MTSTPQKVVVTGAGGHTGQLVFQKLLERSDSFTAVGVVRSEASKAKVQAATGAPAGAIFAADICEGRTLALDTALAGADALIIVTSAVPQIVITSLVKVVWSKMWGQKELPKFTFKDNQKPEQVDWLGQKAQIDAAEAAGVKHVVLVGSMGGTQPDHVLNTFGDGNILLWKRKAEQYLIASGLAYTILHPASLVDSKGGEREIVLGVDDHLMEDSKYRKIPRADVAELCVQALLAPQAENRSIDCGSKPPGEGSPTADFAELFGSFKADCDYSLPRAAKAAVLGSAPDPTSAATEA